MTLAKGVYKAIKKDGTVYYRASITYKNKHISLSSYSNQATAHKAYTEAADILIDQRTHLQAYDPSRVLPFDKWVILHNFRDNGYYFRTPIYLHKDHFVYYLDEETLLHFDVDDLFYYSSHPIHRRGGYYFVNDYGMQINILSRYNIRNHSVLGSDYVFVDRNPHNLRYDNIIVYNPYYGVVIEQKNNRTLYKARIHLNGNYTIGRYHSLEKAAIAYNKAVDFVSTHLISQKNFDKNYIESLDQSGYLAIYEDIDLSSNLLGLVSQKDHL